VPAPRGPSAAVPRAENNGFSPKPCYSARRGPEWAPSRAARVDGRKRADGTGLRSVRFAASVVLHRSPAWSLPPLQAPHSSTPARCCADSRRRTLRARPSRDRNQESALRVREEAKPALPPLTSASSLGERTRGFFPDHRRSAWMRATLAADWLRKIGAD